MPRIIDLDANEIDQIFAQRTSPMTREEFMQRRADQIRDIVEQHMMGPSQLEEGGLDIYARYRNAHEAVDEWKRNNPRSDRPRRSRPRRSRSRPARMAVPDELPIDDIMTERAGLLPTSSRAARLGAIGRGATRALRYVPVVGAAVEAAATANNIRNEGSVSRGLQRTGAGTIDATADLAGGLGRVYWPAQLAEAGLRGLTGAYHRREEREGRQELTDDELLETLLLERSR